MCVAPEVKMSVWMEIDVSPMPGTYIGDQYMDAPHLLGLELGSCNQLHGPVGPCLGGGVCRHEGWCAAENKPKNHKGDGEDEGCPFAGHVEEDGGVLNLSVEQSYDVAVQQLLVSRRI